MQDEVAVSESENKPYSSEVSHSDSKNSISSSSYESASSAISEPVDVCHSPVQTINNKPVAVPASSLTSDDEDDGHHSDGCLSGTTISTNLGNLDMTVSPEMTNLTNDSNYNTFPYVKRHISDIDLSKDPDVVLVVDYSKNPERLQANTQNEVLQQYLTSLYSRKKYSIQFNLI